MLISIIVAVYNIENYIDRCVTSLINQTYKDIEIILVNDGATDNSGKKCDFYKEKDARIVVIHKENGGLSSARNAGMDIAKGEYLLFVDGDDWLDVTYIEKCISKIKKNKVDLLFTPYKREYEDVSIKNNLFNEKEIFFNQDEIQKKIVRRIIGPYKEEMRNASRIDDFSTAWGKFYKTEYCRQIRFVDTKIIGTEDAWFNINVIHNMKNAMYYGEVYMHYNKENQSSLVRTYNQKLFIGWKKLYQYIGDFITRNNLEEQYEIALNNRIIINLFALCRNAINSNLTLKNKSKIIHEILDDEIYKKGFEMFDFSYLEKKWKVFYKLCKWKSFFGIYLMMFLAEKLKKKMK